MSCNAMRRVLALMLLSLAACATPHQPVGGPPGPKATWTVQLSASAGAALIQAAPAGHEALRVACRRNPTDLYVAAPGLAPTPRALTLQVGEKSFPLTGQTEGRTLAAVGPWPDALPASLMSGGTIRLRLGPQSWAFTAPDAKTAAAFAIACRSAAR